ncbi:sortase, partial [Patescibacteria group bacterium]|nr:sortase [Patescibacteria group bacterium]
VGYGFAAFAIAGVLFSFWPIFKEEIRYVFVKPREQISGFGELVSEATAEEADKIREETSSLGLNSYFSLYIPKTEAKANIIPNVDPGNAEEYLEALKEGVAHAKGTNFPGQGSTVYLFSHSTDSPLNFNRYNAVFYLLGKLEKGDRIFMYFLDHRFVYKVDEVVVTDAKDTSWFEKREGSERLVLQTCDPPGTTLRRLLVIASPAY